ncbi:phosphate-import protein PhnD [Catellatospora sp. TT07R-123]|uniref:phosphate/phosphite/phosphonate ABC transporter substrate-binding protein n=1 Tax=Catellatospora sp. TT07R-123 TaxID=2733863 RepID=UPI001B1C1167|nr:phosphate/phosphite/phosphonate ABC transporter substrate-binding protein [Catellatospora sp. TT07R-123]GHJ47233.1 phosphate-import protein PhnD [Catellatospora sp. TT07R-123]
MKISARGLLGAAAAAVLMLGMAACSADKDTPAPGASTEAGTFAKDPGTLVFGVVPDTASTQQNYQPLQDYIAKVTGLKVEYRESSDYAALIEAAVSGKVDVASFSGFTYVTAKKNGAKITPFASIITKAGQEPGYYSEAVVPANSPITKIEEFKGKKVCFVSQTSTSGYLYPSYNLIKAGIDPTKDITPVFAGKHDASALKVSQGTECEAGFAEDVAVEAQPGLKVVSKTFVVGAPMVVSDGLPATLKQKIVDGLRNLTIDQIQAAGIANADSDNFKKTFYALAPVDDAKYNVIRELCQTTKATACGN